MIVFLMSILYLLFITWITAIIKFVKYTKSMNLEKVKFYTSVLILISVIMTIDIHILMKL